MIPSGRENCNDPQNPSITSASCIAPHKKLPCRKRTCAKSPTVEDYSLEQLPTGNLLDDSNDTDSDESEFSPNSLNSVADYGLLGPIFHMSSKKLRRLTQTIKYIIQFVLLALIICGILFIALRFTRGDVGKPIFKSYKFRNAAVATDSPHCSQLGRNILKKGGNAVDAAVAATICLGVRRPFASGIGGGGFMVVHMNEPRKKKVIINSDKNTENAEHSQDSESLTLEIDEDDENTNNNDFSEPGSYSIDFRENAGQNAFRDMYEPTSKYFDANTHPYHYAHYDKSTFGGSSVAVPGEIKGLAVAHEKFGRLPWESLFEESIKMAEEGFIVEKLFALRCKQREKEILSNESLSNLLTKPNRRSILQKWLGRGNDRRVLIEGDFLVQPQLAKTLRLIAKEGPKVFYEGEIMRKMVKSLKSLNSYLTEDDFKRYNVRVSKAHTVPFYGPKDKSNTPRFAFVTTSAPSSGPIMAFALQIIDRLNQEGYFMPKLHPALNPFTKQNSKFWHYTLEVLKHAFSHRSFIGDPKFVENVENFIDLIQDPNYIDSIVKKIHPDHTYKDWSHYAINDTLITPHDSGTTALSIVDEEGNAISMASTVNHSFGSLVYLEDLGFVLNNHMSDFSVSRSRMNVFGFLPSKYNMIEAHKRPVSSISPLILLDYGKTSYKRKRPVVKLAASASGGSTILSALLQSICMHLYLGIPTHHVVLQPRMHILPGMEEVRMETGLPLSYTRELQKYGHQFREQGLLADGHSIGNVQMISRQGVWLEAYSDDRKMGKPSGY